LEELSQSRPGQIIRKSRIGQDSMKVHTYVEDIGKMFAPDSDDEDYVREQLVRVDKADGHTTAGVEGAPN
jgi:hypothetical protein